MLYIRGNPLLLIGVRKCTKSNAGIGLNNVQCICAGAKMANLYKYYHNASTSPYYCIVTV